MYNQLTLQCLINAIMYEAGKAIISGEADKFINGLIHLLIVQS